MTPSVLTPAQRQHAERNLPRYTSYPTSLAFDAEQALHAQDWFARTRAEDRPKRQEAGRPRNRRRDTPGAPSGPRPL